MRAPREHGTVKGARQHRTYRELPCDPCRAALAREAGPRAEARAEAVRRLIAAHRAEFNQLYTEEKDRAGITSSVLNEGRRRNDE